MRKFIPLGFKYGLLERFGPMCDFCFVKHRKGEVWERTKSI